MLRGSSFPPTPTSSSGRLACNINQDEIQSELNAWSFESPFQPRTTVRQLFGFFLASFCGTAARTMNFHEIQSRGVKKLERAPLAWSELWR
jgi:hypothetical protein